MGITKSEPLKGKPRINMPEIYGVPKGKRFFYRIPVSGQQPVTVKVTGLPEGVALNGRILEGRVTENFTGKIHIYAENELGKSEKTVEFRVGQNIMQLTPMMGFTTWNAFGADVTQEKIEKTTAIMAKLGLQEVGYSSMNMDSGWQYEYGGEFDAVMPNSKFPDMRGMTDYIHSFGMKAGIYSTPFLNAWGCPPEFERIPGCSRGEPDPNYSDFNGGIGKERLEANNVKQWDKWNFDYLKYDWFPTIPELAEVMRQELDKLDREVTMCTTVWSGPENGEYWSKRMCAWRNNHDSAPDWANIRDRLEYMEGWKKYVSPGHFYDADMLEIGLITFNNYKKNKEDIFLTDDEELFSYTMRAYFLSPVQLSSLLDELTEFELDMIANEEVIAINQDALCDFPELISNENGLKTYLRKMADGSVTYAVFNIGDNAGTGKIQIGESCIVRDVWCGVDYDCRDTFCFDIPVHGVKLLRVKLS